MNIVQVRLVEDKNAKRYTYRVPENLQLKKNDVVRTKNINGKECIAICITDSENLSENAIDMIMSGNKVKSDIIGIYEFKDKVSDLTDTKIDDIDKIGKVLFKLVLNCGYRLSVVKAHEFPYDFINDMWLLEKKVNGHMNSIYIEKNNTSYENFIHDLIEQYTNYNINWYSSLGNDISFREVYRKDIEDIGIIIRN